MFLRYNIHALIWALFIAVLTLTPSKSMLDLGIWDFFAFDKVIHAISYAVLVFFLIIGFVKQHTFISLRFRPKRNAFFSAICFGLFLELAQLYSPGRQMEMMDILTNVVGCFVGLLFFFLIYKI